MISKELLSAVLKINRIQSIEAKEDMLLGNTNTFLSIIHLHSQGRAFADTIQERSVNIHELAHMVKEWAYDNGYEISSKKILSEGLWDSEVAWEHKEYKNWLSNDFEADTEPEAIFKAGEYILEEISK